MCVCVCVAVCGAVGGVLVLAAGAFFIMRRRSEQDVAQVPAPSFSYLFWARSRYHDPLLSYIFYSSLRVVAMRCPVLPWAVSSYAVSGTKMGYAATRSWRR